MSLTEHQHNEIQKAAKARCTFMLNLIVLQGLKFITNFFLMALSFTKLTCPLLLSIFFGPSRELDSLRISWLFFFWNVNLFLCLLPFLLGGAIVKRAFSALLRLNLSSSLSTNRNQFTDCPFIPQSSLWNFELLIPSRQWVKNLMNNIIICYKDNHFPRFGSKLTNFYNLDSRGLLFWVL